jgi:AraC-like DNA-binding protein
VFFCLRHELNAERLMLRLDVPANGRVCLKSSNCETASVDLHQRIERTILFMKEHLDRPLSAPELAAQAAMSLSHYFALFKRLKGRTPIDYLIHLRMQRGRQLLDSTSLSVKEVAAALGYDDPFYFSRVFKSVHGVAPTDYRSSPNGRGGGRPVTGTRAVRDLRSSGGLGAKANCRFAAARLSAVGMKADFT